MRRAYLSAVALPALLLLARAPLAGTLPDELRPFFHRLGFTVGAANYAAPNGSGALCTLNSPCSIHTGVHAIAAGDTLRLKGGTYNGQVTITESGVQGLPRVLMPHGDGAVVLTATLPAVSCAITSSNDDRTLRFQNGADDWIVRDFTGTHRIERGISIEAAISGLTNEERKALKRDRSIPGHGSRDPAGAVNALAAAATKYSATINPADRIEIINNRITLRGVTGEAARWARVEDNDIGQIECSGPGVQFNLLSDFAVILDNLIHDLPSTDKHWISEGIRLGASTMYADVSFNTVQDIAPNGGSGGRGIGTDVNSGWNDIHHNTIRRTDQNFSDQAGAWGNAWHHNRSEGARKHHFSIYGVGQDPQPGWPDDRVPAFTTQECNIASGTGATGLNIGGVRNATFRRNDYGTVELSGVLRDAWGGEAQNTWEGSSSPPSGSPAPGNQGTCGGIGDTGGGSGTTLTPPTNLTATPILPTQVDLAWTPGTGEAFVLLYKGPEAATCDTTTISAAAFDSVAAGVVSYAHQGRTPAKTTPYRIKAKSAAGALSSSPQAVCATTPAEQGGGGAGDFRGRLLAWWRMEAVTGSGGFPDSSGNGFTLAVDGEVARPDTVSDDSTSGSRSARVTPGALLLDEALLGSLAGPFDRFAGALRVKKDSNIGWGIIGRWEDGAAAVVAQTFESAGTPPNWTYSGCAANQTGVVLTGTRSLRICGGTGGPTNSAVQSPLVDAAFYRLEVEALLDSIANDATRETIQIADSLGTDFAFVQINASDKFKLCLRNDAGSNVCAVGGTDVKGLVGKQNLLWKVWRATNASSNDAHAELYLNGVLEVSVTGVDLHDRWGSGAGRKRIHLQPAGDTAGEPVYYDELYVKTTDAEGANNHGWLMRMRPAGGWAFWWADSTAAIDSVRSATADYGDGPFETVGWSFENGGDSLRVRLFQADTGGNASQVGYAARARERLRGNTGIPLPLVVSVNGLVDEIALFDTTLSLAAFDSLHDHGIAGPSVASAAPAAPSYALTFLGDLDARATTGAFSDAGDVHGSTVWQLFGRKAGDVVVNTTRSDSLVGLTLLGLPLLEGGDYVGRAAHCDDGGLCGAFSDSSQAAARIHVPVQPPGQPAAAVVDRTKAQLAWVSTTARPDAGYLVQRADLSGGSCGAWARVDSTGATSALIAGHAADDSVCFRIKAVVPATSITNADSSSASAHVQLVFPPAATPALEDSLAWALFYEDTLNLAADSSGAGNHGTVSGVTLVPGKASGMRGRGAARFNGGAVLTLPSNATTQMKLAWTVTNLLKYRGAGFTSPADHIVGQRDPNGIVSWAVQVADGPRLESTVKGSSGQTIASWAPFANDTLPRTVAVYYDGDSLGASLCVKGQACTDLGRVAADRDTLLASSDPITFGARLNTSLADAFDLFLAADLDDSCGWRRKLTQVEIQAVADSGCAWVVRGSVPNRAPTIEALGVTGVGQSFVTLLATHYDDQDGDAHTESCWLVEVQGAEAEPFYDACNTNRTRFTLIGLDPGTNYDFAVAAKDDRGLIGPYTELGSFATLTLPPEPIPHIWLVYPAKSSTLYLGTAPEEVVKLSGENAVLRFDYSVGLRPGERVVPDSTLLTIYDASGLGRSGPQADSLGVVDSIVLNDEQTAYLVYLSADAERTQDPWRITLAAYTTSDQVREHAVVVRELAVEPFPRRTAKPRNNRVDVAADFRHEFGLEKIAAAEVEVVDGAGRSSPTLVSAVRVSDAGGVVRFRLEPSARPVGGEGTLRYRVRATGTTGQTREMNLVVTNF